MPHIAFDRVRILKLLITILVATSASNGILAQNAARESNEPNNIETKLNNSDVISNESDTVMVKQHLNATLKHNTLKNELFRIDQRIRDIEHGRGHSSNRLIITNGSSPVTLKELQKRRKQIMKELSKLRSGNKSARVGE